MNYDARERWIRDRICMRNQEMTPGKYSDQIETTVEPTSEMVQLGSNWEIELYTGCADGKTDDGWFIEVFEKSTEREFTIYINLKK